MQLLKRNASSRLGAGAGDSAEVQVRTRRGRTAQAVTMSGLETIVKISLELSKCRRARAAPSMVGEKCGFNIS